MLFGLSVWGWLNQLWIASGLLIVLLLLITIIPWRWPITEAQFFRLGDLVTLPIVLFLLYGYLILSDQNTIFSMLKWLPLFFSPILFGQLLSIENRLPLGALFHSLRKQHDGVSRTVDFRQPYAAITLLSSAAANNQSQLYFILIVIAVGAMLWHARPKEGSVILWATVLTLAIPIAYWTHHGLRTAHSMVEALTIEWFSNWQSDPFKSHTSIGDIGQLKLSDKIELRVKADGPLLLHETSYDQYLNGEWYASARHFKPRPIDQSEPTSDTKVVEIYQQFEQDAIIAMPAGTVKISGLEGADLFYNRFGSVKVIGPPPFAHYLLFYNPLLPSPSSKKDRQVPAQHSDWLASVAKKLSLEGRSPQQIADRIKAYFQNNFYYSLNLGNETDANQALRRFMLGHRAGHCEYFASATVLLLRQAGLSARLANGYAVAEYNASDQLYIVRRRHAHAWALAHIDGRWQVVDSTPAQWLESEARNASPFQPITDWFANQLFFFRQWRMEHNREQINRLYLLTGAALLAAYLLFRLYRARRKMVKRAGRSQTEQQQVAFQGADSPFYRIEKRLQNSAQARNHNETIQSWISRLDCTELEPLCKSHYRLRYDPQGVNDDERVWLDHAVQQWLEVRSKK